MGSSTWSDCTLIVAKDAVKLLGDASHEECSGKRGKVKTFQGLPMLLKEKYGDALFYHLQE